MTRKFFGNLEADFSAAQDRDLETSTSLESEQVSECLLQHFPYQACINDVSQAGPTLLAWPNSGSSSFGASIASSLNSAEYSLWHIPSAPIALAIVVLAETTLIVIDRTGISVVVSFIDSR
jgi:hypothetical protein